MDDTEQNRSEEPTPYKLSRARRKGSVARGSDLAFFSSALGFFAFVSLMGPQARGQIALSARRALSAAPTVSDEPAALLSVAGHLMEAAARPLGFLAATVFVAVLALEIVQTGLVFSFEPLKADFSRLSPAQNAKRVFSTRLLIETVKTIAKIAVYFTVTYLVIRAVRTTVLPAIFDAQSLAHSMGQAMRTLVIFFVLGALLFAVVDQFIVRRQFLTRMKMSRRELRREVRDREGDARMKQRRRQLHGEFVKISKSVRNIKGADVLITNPTHFAVGLRYEPGTMAAPLVVARGSHQVAQRLKRLAFVYGVIVVEDPPLARALFQSADLDRPIPEALYRSVADVYQLNRARKQSGVNL